MNRERIRAIASRVADQSFVDTGDSVLPTWDDRIDQFQGVVEFVWNDVIDALIADMRFGEWGDPVLIEELENGDPMTVTEWLEDQKVGDDE